MTVAWCDHRPIAQPTTRMKPMGNVYEIYALRYATMSPRTPHLNYLLPDPHETTAQDLDYFVWLIRGHGRDILVDTGFNAEEASLRSRKLTLNPVDALARFGVNADEIKDVVVTHLHYDHAGNLDRFPNARFHLQDREMSYATGRCMCHGTWRHPFPILYNLGDMFEGWDIAQRLAGHPDRVIPGHDPIVTEIYPRASDKVDAYALHLA